MVRFIEEPKEITYEQVLDYCKKRNYTLVDNSLWQKIVSDPLNKSIPIKWIINYTWGADTHEEKQALRKMYMRWEDEKAAAFEKAMCNEWGTPYEND